MSHLVRRGTEPSQSSESLVPDVKGLLCFVMAADGVSTDGGEAIQTLKTPFERTLGISVSMLKGKVFWRFERDEEVRLVMLCTASLYAERFDPDVGLRRSLKTALNAESHHEEARAVAVGGRPCGQLSRLAGRGLVLRAGRIIRPWRLLHSITSHQTSRDLLLQGLKMRSCRPCSV